MRDGAVEANGAEEPEPEGAHALLTQLAVSQLAKQSRAAGSAAAEVRLLRAEIERIRTEMATFANGYPSSALGDFVVAPMAPLTSELPILFLHHWQEKDVKDNSFRDNTMGRLKFLLAWAVPLAPARLTIIEVRVGLEKSVVPDLLPTADARAHDEYLQVVHVPTGFSDTVHMSGPRALICGDVLEHVLYPCHDLLRSGVESVGVVPQLCGSSGRSGELSRAHSISHLEEVLNVRVHASTKAAAQWLVPGGPDFFDTAVANDGVKVIVDSEDDTVLTSEQEQVVRLILPENVVEVTLTKLGKGWSSALKFFVRPVVQQKGIKAPGAMTFIKIGDEGEIEEELNVTNHMGQILGPFCPHVLGYAECGDTGAIHLSLADLGTGCPRSLADLYGDLLKSASSTTAKLLRSRVEGTIDFIFGTLARQLHGAQAEETAAFNIADELGLTKDLGAQGSDGLEPNPNMSSGWVLEKVWKKKPGDGALASSVRIHMEAILGAEAAKADTLSFLAGHPLRLPNICTFLLAAPEALERLQAGSYCSHRRCFVHGDLHADNIMVDQKDNRFLIDFGKTGLGHCLEDVTWLEAFVLLSYTQYTDATLADALSFVPALAPAEGLGAEACDSVVLDQVAGVAGKKLVPEVAAMWSTVKSLRVHLANSFRSVAAASGAEREEEVRRAGLVASMLMLRNCLFFMTARENADKPQRKVFALALACAYAQSAQATANAFAKGRSPRKHIKTPAQREQRRSSRITGFHGSLLVQQ